LSWNKPPTNGVLDTNKNKEIMKQTINSAFLYSNVEKPQAYIAKSKQRVKQHDSNVYFSDGDEYQIELFNPTTLCVLAKIKLDGKYISNGGIVLRPGERVFLERYLDTNNKFVYRTYEVNGNNTQVQRAIQNNGKVEVEFYDEYIPSNITWTTGTSNYYPLSGTINTTSISSQWDGTVTTSNSAYYTNTSFNNANVNGGDLSVNGDIYIKGQSLSKVLGLSDRKIETGTTEKGEESNQTFEHSNKSFNLIASRIVQWQILPTSHKPYTTKELNVLYCGECGAKRKKDSHKFCPHCGTKY
jgi:hypothetical protein